jgi:hypothetical protein
VAAVEDVGFFSSRQRVPLPIKPGDDKLDSERLFFGEFRNA